MEICLFHGTNMGFGFRLAACAHSRFDEAEEREHGKETYGGSSPGGVMAIAHW